MHVAFTFLLGVVKQGPCTCRAKRLLGTCNSYSIYRRSLIFFSYKLITHVCKTIIAGQVISTSILKECGYNDYHINVTKRDSNHRWQMTLLMKQTLYQPSHHGWFYLTITLLRLDWELQKYLSTIGF